MKSADGSDANSGARARTEGHPLGRRPLYAQVRDLIVDQMISGRWQPGDMLPNEMTLAFAVPFLSHHRRRGR